MCFFDPCSSVIPEPPSTAGVPESSETAESSCHPEWTCHNFCDASLVWHGNALMCPECASTVQWPVWRGPEHPLVHEEDTGSGLPRRCLGKELMPTRPGLK